MFSPTFVTLPLQLIVRIIDSTDPSDHLNIACTCSYLRQCATKSLNHHRDAHEKFSVASDLDPSTIPTLLRSASGITSPIDAWHVQNIEIWGSRWNWKEWRTWELNKSPAAWHQISKRRQVFAKSPVLEWSIPPWELTHYLRIMRERLSLPGDFVDSARLEFEKGCDSVMQMLLIVLCPRLKSLKYMYNRHDKVAYRRSLYWLTPVMGKSWVDDSWPPGLSKLHDVAVGVRSETWLDDEDDKLWYARSAFRGFFKLPEISTLYFRGLRQQDHPSMPHDSDWNLRDGESIFDTSISSALQAADELPARCSTIKHLYLESPGDYRELECIAAAPRALKSYTLHGGEIHYGSGGSLEMLLKDMVEEQRQSLESILVYNTSRFEESCCTLRPSDGAGYIEMHDCPQLRQLYIHSDDLQLLYHELHRELPPKDSNTLQGFVDYIMGFLPASLELLMLGSAKNSVAVNVPETQFEDFGFGKFEELNEHILISVVSSKRFPALKAILVERTEDSHEFTQLIEVGRERGVDIYITANDQVLPHQTRLPQRPRATSHQPHGEIDQEPPNEQLQEKLDEGNETDDDCGNLQLTGMVAM
ncbi:uncharacterized protein FPRO_13686 [Fusarium proliferatum ET1]|uniref:F-box domain-containing protein n=1 Tax=Fusarium proliferatum (strain ET1) TaxID=1227346 RepID=A0A1L7VTZ7_FUSPR|nr:uncharacterized protein FPRO_13686 [Fusarium proliferatum ET1]CZR43878.1 uncharacterized protein FPRO_13686 [Fusarium proliferatum ET1]